MPQYGLLGEKLGHSYSVQIHRLLGNEAYALMEKTPAEIADFMAGDWRGINVTVPYKKTVLPFMDELSPCAQAVGCVNTVVRRANGTLYGDNTDVWGFQALLSHGHIQVAGKKTLIFGNGGAGAAICAAVKAMSGEPIIISRRGEDNYTNLHRHRDAQILVNATPLGMYPGNGVSPVDVALFPCCEAAVDAVYNPARTAFLLQAESLGIKTENGLYMLVAQAVRSAELFAEQAIPASEVDRIYGILRNQMQNIVLIGMPGCGKSTVAEAIGALTHRPVADSDGEIEKREGQSPSQIINSRGEAAFRAIETEVLKALGARSGIVLATGGGAVTRPENCNLLRQNSTVIWLQCPLDRLATDNRPLSEQNRLSDLYAAREPLYRRFADGAVAVSANAIQTAETVIQAVKHMLA